MSKKLFIITFMATSLFFATQVQADNQTIKRRPDNPSFVTETQVRYSSTTATIAQVDQATKSGNPSFGLWQTIKQSWQDFLSSVRNLFN